jgi:fumarate hydratase class II
MARSTTPSKAKTRSETDSFGPIDVPADRYWGAQTQRSLGNFKIGWEKHAAFGRACARHRQAGGRARQHRARPARCRRSVRRSSRAAQEVIDGKLDDHFPAGGLADRLRHAVQHERQRGDLQPRDRDARRRDRLQEADPSERPRQHEPVVERHLPDGDACRLPRAHRRIDLLPALKHLLARCEAKVKAFAKIVKIGRTHTQDATPLTLGQEFSGYAAQVASASSGSTARRGEGSGARPGRHRRRHRPERAEGFARRPSRAEEIAEITGLDRSRQRRNKFEALAANDAYVLVHGAINSAAAGLFKIANDIRFLGSGPRSGLGELSLPENEPGSSIMPGKVNPTQCEAHDAWSAARCSATTALTLAGSQGHFELNVYKPVMAYNFLQIGSAAVADAVRSFTEHCVVGIEADEKRINDLMQRSLMLVTALAPKIGYDNAAKIAKSAHARGTTLKEEALRLGLVSADEFDRLVQPDKMTHPG